MSCLGTNMSSTDDFLKMDPSPLYPNCLRYPFDRLLPLQDIMKDDELRLPTMLDWNDARCLLVVKNGASTGVTIGRASGMRSFVREYFVLRAGGFWVDHRRSDGTYRRYAERRSGPGRRPRRDIPTPFYWLFDECIKKQFPEACLYQPTA